MPFYHVRITRKSQVSGDLLQLDLTRHSLMKDIVNLYLQDKQFFCGNTYVDPSDVKAIKINKTDRRSKDLIPAIHNRREKKTFYTRISHVISDKWYVTEEGQDVTRQFIKSPLVKNTEPEVKKTTPSLSKKIFIGHGHDEQWRLLKDHLFHQQKFEVTFYEAAPRAGLNTPEVLKKMLDETDIAFLIFTGEVTHTDGTLHARDNVIHELGLFQARLGFANAIMLLENGVYEHSNVHGINQIRFPKGRLQEKYGDVVAAIRDRRER